MKVLLISANTQQINMPVLPMGLASVAESVQRAGHEVKLVNLMAKPQSRSSISPPYTFLNSQRDRESDRYSQAFAELVMEQ